MPTSAWDIMSCVDCARHFLGWHKLKLGWLSESNMIVLSSGQLLLKLTSFHKKKGIKMIKIPHPEDTTHKRAHIIEIAQGIGKRTEILNEGVLVYSIDTSTEDGLGPININTRKITEDQSLKSNNGLKYDAPLKVNENLDLPLGNYTLSISIMKKRKFNFTVQVSLLPQSYNKV